MCVCVPEVVDSSGGLVQLTLNLIQATGGLGLIDSHRVGVKRVIHAPVKIRKVNNNLHEHVYCNNYI